METSFNLFKRCIWRIVWAITPWTLDVSQKQSLLSPAQVAWRGLLLKKLLRKCGENARQCFACSFVRDILWFTLSKASSVSRVTAVILPRRVVQELGAKKLLDAYNYLEGSMR